MSGLEALRDAAFNYVGIVVALFVAQVSTITAIGAFVLLMLRIAVELPKALAVIKSFRRRSRNE